MAKRKRNRRKSRARAKGPRLSLCMIVRDEEYYLPGCLECVRDAVDEIVVVDTGSTDSTVEIAERYGAEVYHYEWKRDFAAARNESLKHATGDWVLVLDADERLDEKNLALLKMLIRKPKVDAYLVNLLALMDDVHSPIAHTGKAYRLFKRLPGIEFEGAIHEQVTASLQRMGAVVHLCELTIEHLGYAKEQAELQGKYERNMDILARQLVVNSSDPQVYFHLGQTLMLMDRYDEAVPIFEECLTLGGIEKSVVTSVHNNLACCYLNLKRYDEALRETDKSLELIPVQAMAHMMRYRVHAQCDNYRPAIAELEAILETVPKVQGSGSGAVVEVALMDLSAIFYKMGICYGRLGEYENAIGSFTKALQERPEDVATMIEMGKCHLRTRDFAQAQAVLEDASMIDPDLPDLHKLRGMVHLSAGRPEEAIRVLEHVLEQSPDDAEALIYLAKAYSTCGREAEAEATHERIEALGISSARDLFNMALLYDSLGERERAINLCRSAIFADGSVPQAHFFLGCTLLNRNLYDEAERCFLKVQSLSPDVPEIYHNLGYINIKRGDYERALPYFMKLVELRPEDESARRKLMGLSVKIERAKPKETPPLASHVQPR